MIATARRDTGEKESIFEKDGFAEPWSEEIYCHHEARFSAGRKLTRRILLDGAGVISHSDLRYVSSNPCGGIRSLVSHQAIVTAVSDGCYLV